jgi:predicted metalloprotease
MENTGFFNRYNIQGDTKRRELLKTPTKIEEIQEKNLLKEIEPLQLAF